MFCKFFFVFFYRYLFLNKGILRLTAFWILFFLPSVTIRGEQEYPASEAATQTIVSKAASANQEKKDYVLILCFHDIGNRGRYAVSKDDLKEIFSFLQNDFTVLSLRDWYAAYRKKIVFAKPVVVLTFDDGYASVFKDVVPLLKTYNFGASFFIYTDLYRDNSIFYKKLAALDKRWEVGGHSAGHVDLKQLWPLSRLKFYHELYLSRKKLEYLSSKEITSFAWPFGVYSKELVEMAGKAGYLLQVSTDGVIAYVEKDMVLFPRVTVQQPRPVEQVKRLLKNYKKLF